MSGGGQLARADGGVAPSPDAAQEARLELVGDGHIGAFLVAGPYPRPPALSRGSSALDEVPEGVDERGRSYSRGAAFGPRTFQPRLARSGSIDLRDALDSTGEALAYAAVILRVRARAELTLLLGSDDGVRVLVDGQAVFSRDEARPPREDDDAVPLVLEPGDHPLLLKLHQRDGAWQLRARLVGPDFRAPGGVSIVLPGAAPELERREGEFARVSLARDLDPTASELAATLVVRFPEGLREGQSRAARAKLIRGTSVLFDVRAGEVARSGASRITLPRIPLEELGDDAILEAHVGSRQERFPVALPFPVTRALSRAARILSALSPEDSAKLEDAALTARTTIARLRAFLAEGDTDRPALEEEAKELDLVSEALEARRDPYLERTGAMRRAYISKLDGKPQELGLYVPASFRPGTRRTYPLVVALHGLNGKPMQMIRWFFGKDDPGHDGAWEDRHATKLRALEAFVLAPSGHGNSMYREMGEDDVLRALSWVKERYPIDASRVTITGPSMGGIGAAAIPLRHPSLFAGAAPLCGYHSTFVRRDVMGKRLRPWEQLLAEERSNVEWARNGQRLPLYIVHGTRDLPEENSLSLIERYTKLRYSVKHEHPALGHNVWQPTYEKPETAAWLLGRYLDPHPKWVTFRTARTRWGDAAWVHVEELLGPAGWGEVTAHVTGRDRVTASTSGIAQLRLDRDPALVDARAPLRLKIDGAELVFAPEELVILHREGSLWKRGAIAHAAPVKSGRITGPFRDVFHEPLLFVYGASTPEDASVNEKVARVFAEVRLGLLTRYPVMSDLEFFERGEPLANERSLFLVGSPRSNRVVAELEKSGRFPISLDGQAIRVGSRRFEGRELGAAFVRPNPRRADRYVALVFGTTPTGTLRAMSLPDLLPDFVVYDAGVAPARGQLVLGSATLRAAGFFGVDWELPSSFDDPFAGRGASSPKNEREATAYLP